MKKIISYFMSTFAIVIFFIGVYGFSDKPLSFLSKNPEQYEAPLSKITGLAVDPNGNIYCGLFTYSRVQVYDPEGIFLYHISLPGIDGIMYMRFNNDEQLEIASPRGKKRCIFSKDGKLLSKKEKYFGYVDGFDKKSEYLCYDEKRDVTYQIKPILLNSIFLLGEHIVKKDASGKETVIISTPFPKCLFMKPFPAGGFLILGMILSFIFNPIARKDLRKRMRW